MSITEWPLFGADWSVEEAEVAVKRMSKGSGLVELDLDRQANVTGLAW